MELYTVKEAAEKYFSNNVSPSHLYNLVKEKRLNCIYIGNKILIPKNSLDDFCKANLNF